jgi:hypothetical protein
MIEVYTGKCGTGKTLRLADKMVETLARNARWSKKTGQRRAIATNCPLSPDFVALYPEGSIIEWKDPLQLVQFRDVDIFWDEISTHLDATQWASLPLEVKRFLQQHRKKGIDIYGSTQTFAAVDVSMRRLVDNLYVCYKMIGSRNPSPTKPPVRLIWGLIWMKQLDPMTFEDEKPKYLGFDWLFITEKLCKVYDTTFEIEVGQYPALKHIERHCSKAGCDYVSVNHR